MDTKKVADFEVGDNVTGYFAVRRADVREYTKGQFVSLEIGDSSGRIGAVIWEADRFCLEELEAGMVIKGRGQVGEYNGKKQLRLDRIRLATEDEYDLDDILPHSSFSIDQRKARILALSDKIENSYIKTLADSFWNDEEWFESFLTAPAGKLWHHAFIGGLAEHSANMAELALRVSEGYEYLNKDYLIFTGLFHDAGKINSYKTTTIFDYSDEGRLVDHICIMDDWLCTHAREIDSFPKSLLMKLRHLLLSHQGEFSTPVVPKMPEAFVIYYCDEIDSKMGAIERIRNKQGGTGWSDYVRLLDRHLFFGNSDED